MIRWTELGVATAPGGDQLRLMQRGSEFSIMVGSDELMNSRRGGSEAALAELACARLGDIDAPHVLIGGLGMGFTLRAALSALGAHARVTVAELVPEVVSWARGPLVEVFQKSLEDARVRIVVGDVAMLIRAASSTYDAVLLDVDNGPDALVHAGNRSLYDRPGLAAVRQSLRPGGVLAIWSASQSPAFVGRLRNAGFDVDEVLARSARARGARHVIWLSTPKTV